MTESVGLTEVCSDRCSAYATERNFSNCINLSIFLHARPVNKSCRLIQFRFASTQKHYRQYYSRPKQFIQILKIKIRNGIPVAMMTATYHIHNPNESWNLSQTRKSQTAVLPETGTISIMKRLLKNRESWNNQLNPFLHVPFLFFPFFHKCYMSKCYINFFLPLVLILISSV